MIKIGLTGSIGSGKSSIARMAAEEMGMPVFDADKAVHDLYAQDAGLKDFLIGLCGPGIVQNNDIDRQALKAIMKDPARQQTWKSIESEVHRRVWQAYDDFVAEKTAAGHTHILADVPLLFETGAEARFDYTINVSLPFDVQKERALARETPKLTEADFQRRFAVFMPNEQRNRRSDFVIDNSGERDASFLQFRFHVSNMRDVKAQPTQAREDFNKAAVYVGSFDPMTLGHVDVMKSASKLPYDKIYVAVGINPDKKSMFTTEERIAMIEREMDRDVRPHLPAGREIVVTAYEGLTVDFMRSVGASVCIRGLRGFKDLEEEGNLAAVNRDLYADGLDEPGTAEFTQVYFATSNPDLRHVSSSFARALATGKKDLSLLRYVSADVAAKMIKKRDITLHGTA